MKLTEPILGRLKVFYDVVEWNRFIRQPDDGKDRQICYLQQVLLKIPFNQKPGKGDFTAAIQLL